MTCRLPTQRRLPFRLPLCRLVLGALLASGGCAELEKERPVTVTLEGPHSAQVGETLELRASTQNGSDPEYAWQSSDEGIATVDDAGTVTTRMVGEATITATGSRTGEVGERVLTVVPDVDAQVPHFSDWLGSAHARAEDEAFTHWDEDGEIEADCAACHSQGGYLDFLGADGTAAGVVDGAAELGTTVDCATCHDPAAEALDTVSFASDVTVDGLGAEARCMVCHQGRASGAQVDEALEMAGLIDGAGKLDADTQSEDLSFLNIHYYPAAATLYAGRAMGGYQYPGAVYDWRFRHVPGYDTCTGCHDAHTLQVKVDECSSCHAGVENVTDLRGIRMIASAGNDYDGDGDVSEGIAEEIDGLRQTTLAALQAYAMDQDLGDVCYDANAYPYFFQDMDGSGSCEDDEASFPNRYAAWTPRLLQGAYNYQMATKDPGGYSHNAKYLIQLLSDSIADLKAAGGERLDAIDTGGAVRNDDGHFNGAGEAARHWDEDDEVQASCSACHAGAEGLRAFVELGVSVPVEEPDNGLDCATCHDTFGLPGEDNAYSTLAIGSVRYPGGHVAEGEPEPDNLCRTCHQGRVAGADLKRAIAAGGPLRFMNVHYLAAASTQLGSQVGLGFEYAGKAYAGPSDHADLNDCTSCHDPVASDHSFRIEDAFETVCKDCHRDHDTAESIRAVHELDYDGDGDDSEALAEEVQTLAGALLRQLQTAASSEGTDLCYDSHSYPYFFIDSDGDGSCSGGEAIFPNQYSPWTPALLAAAHNYQISQTEPGAWAHNFDYITQLLIDAIEDLGGDISGYTRP